MKIKVQDVMTADVIAVNESTPLKEIVELLARHRISAVPVLDAAGRVTGWCQWPTCCSSRSGRRRTGHVPR
jgi:CBS domain-containing protein